ncbi:MAG: hypothetical protein M1823_000236 [Watsoniomyces obsoletus]|nr:MAG: hypothetical protein M1823_000236 [Watsoniomyces obsoletus]
MQSPPSTPSSRQPVDTSKYRPDYSLPPPPPRRCGALDVKDWLGRYFRHVSRGAMDASDVASEVDKWPKGCNSTSLYIMPIEWYIGIWGKDSGPRLYHEIHRQPSAMERYFHFFSVL